jgi:hypothetical protein
MIAVAVPSARSRQTNRDDRAVKICVCGENLQSDYSSSPQTQILVTRRSGTRLPALGGRANIELGVPARFKDVIVEDWGCYGEPCSA